MARPKVTAAALQRARELAARCNERPVVVVRCNPATVDKRRGSDGETIWMRSTREWKVDVADLHLEKDADMPLINIGGLQFLFVGHDLGESLGAITIDCADGELVVREAI